MGMPDTFKVDRLTNEKASHIAIRDDYHVTGYVLSSVVGKETRKCIVDFSVVRWMGGNEFFEMMHPVNGASADLVQRYNPTNAGEMVSVVTNDDAYVQSSDYDRLDQKYLRAKCKIALLNQLKPKTFDSDAVDSSGVDIWRGWNACLAAVKEVLKKP